MDKSIKILGISFSSKGKHQLLSELGLWLDNSRETAYIVTPNPEQVVQASADVKFKEDLERAEFSIADGVGIVWASRVLSHLNQGRLVPARISGRELVVDLLAAARERELKALILGGREYVEVDFTQDAKRPAVVEVAGQAVHWWPGYADVSQPTEQEELDVARVLAEVKPGIVFVAFGAPHQERWMMSHTELLEKSGVRLCMAVGGSFDYLLGKVPQVPAWIASAGFEWLFRLVTQPWRWRRQLRLIQFIYLVFREKFTPH